MASLIETLESRTLLSGTVLQAESVGQAVTALQTDASQTRIDVTSGAKVGAADLAAVKADLHRLRSVPANAGLMSQFAKQEHAGYSRFKLDVAALAHSVSKGTKSALAKGINFILHPGNVKATAALGAELTALQQLTTSSPALKLAADLNSSTAVVSGDLGSIAVADADDAKTVADATTAKTDLATSSGKLQADVTALEADLNTLIDAVKAVEAL